MQTNRCRFFCVIACFLGGMASSDMAIAQSELVLPEIMPLEDLEPVPVDEWLRMEEDFPRAPKDELKTPEDACNQYALNITALVLEGKKKACEFDWVADYASHYNLCLQGKTDNKEISRMQADLAKCLACKDHSQIASSINDKNTNLSCGLNAGYWYLDDTDHYAWCMKGQNAYFASSKIKEMESDIQRCLTCKDHSKQAESLIKRNFSLGCAFYGQHWRGGTTNFSWCMQASNYKNAGNVIKGMKKALHKCEFERPLDGGFSIKSVDLKFDQKTGVTSTVDISIQATSNQDWVLGDYGGVPGSIWAEIRVSNMAVSGIKNVYKKNSKFFFSISGKKSDQTIAMTFVSPAKDTKIAKGKKVVSIKAKPYPAVKLSGVRVLYPFSLDDAIGCSHFDPEMEVDVFLITTTGIRKESIKQPIAIPKNLYESVISQKPYPDLGFAAGGYVWTACEEGEL